MLYVARNSAVLAALVARGFARRLPKVAVAPLLAPLRGREPVEAAPPAPCRCALVGTGMPVPTHLQDHGVMTP